MTNEELARRFERLALLMEIRGDDRFRVRSYRNAAETLLDLLEVEGVGPKTAATLYQQFKISSLEDLLQFVEGGGLDLVDGVGEKTAERIARSARALTGK